MLVLICLLLCVFFCQYSYSFTVAFALLSRLCSIIDLTAPDSLRCAVSPYLITDDSNDPSLASLPAWRSRNRGASSPQIFD